MAAITLYPYFTAIFSALFRNSYELGVITAFRALLNTCILIEGELFTSHTIDLKMHTRLLIGVGSFIGIGGRPGF